ncbi:VWA domain-containing protein, partial [Pirellulales bacterium]|nr:VWA domain-containing protein [Pirellulales bacterium]
MKMPNWAGDQKKTPGQGWRGRGTGTAKPGYAWQGKPKSDSTPGRGRGRSLFAGWRIYAVLGAGLLALFVSFLLFGPAKTPLLLVVGEEYAAPTPPNAWVDEDRNALQELKHTLVLSEVKGSWQGAATSDAYEAFRQQLESHRRLRRGFRRIREPLVIYISMPGVVDAQGRPCLLPPGASPLTSDDWLSVEAVIAQIEDVVPAERTKLLVLDSAQQLVNWRMGVVYNTFVERVQGLVEGSSVRNLAVMTSAAAGQQSHASPEMGGTVFGQFFRMGIAGAADLAAAAPDEKVSLDELATYVRTEVARWAKQSRGAPQEPAVFRPRGDEHDFFVTHALDEDGLKAYRQQLIDGRPVSSTVSLEELEGLWQQLDDLRQRDLLRYDPLSLARFEQQLLRVEKLAFAGDGCGGQAEGLLATVDEQMRRAAERVRQESPALADHWRIGNPDDAEGVRLTTGMHSCRLREYFGQPVDADAIESFWQQIATRKAVRAEPSVLQSALPLGTTQLVVAAAQQGLLDAQQSAQQLLTAIDRRILADALAVPWATPQSNSGARIPGDERAHYFVRVALDAADQERRLAEDDLFVYASQGAAESSHARKAAQLYQSAEEIGTKASELLRVCDQACAETPYLAERICSMSNAAEPRQIEKLIGYLRATRKLADAVGGLERLPTADDDLRDVIEQLTSAAAEIPQLRAQYRGDFHGSYEHLGAGVSGSEMAIIESALATPLIEAKARRNLMVKREKLARSLHRSFFEQGAAGATERASTSKRGGGTDDSSEPGDSFAEVMAKWPRSPLLALLETPGAAESANGADASGPARFEADCWAARAKLRRLGVLQEARTEQDADDVVQTRRPLSRSERSMRAAASICSLFPEHDPIARLRTYDLQQLLLWHARRSLQDFWDYAVDVETATAEDLLSPSIVGDSSASTYFADAARDYAAGVETLNTTYKKWFHGSIPVQLERLEGDLENSLESAEHAVQLRVRLELNLDRGTEVAVNLEVEPGIVEPVSLPVGRAALYLAHNRVRLTTVSTRSSEPASIALPIDSPHVDRISARSDDETELDAIAFFRGHQYRQPFVVDDPEGAVVSYRLPNYNRQSVTLFGSEPNPPSVVFVLDCSFSMEALITGPEGEQTRMAVAVNALKTMLADLSKRQTATPRVGLFFFGHRRAFTSDTNRLVRSAYAKKFFAEGAKRR